MSALDRLAEIEQRSNASTIGKSAWRNLDAALIDIRKTVAALRAVLGNHWCIEGGEECGYDGRSWPCPDYRAITEALGGGE